MCCEYCPANGGGCCVCETELEATWDRSDICEAYAVLEWDHNFGGILQQRPTCARRNQSVGVQLKRMRFRARPSLCHDTLTDNGRAIYKAAARRMGLASVAVR
jgi:hypothetical protein